MITAFRGHWKALSNFYPCAVFYNGRTYKSVEHAYQALKSDDPAVQKMISDQPDAREAKKLGRRITLRPGWDAMRVPLMRDLLREKFSTEPERSLLLSTGEEQLVEGNFWGDTFWGECPVGTGENWLGVLLMEIRQDLRGGMDE